LAGTAFKLDKKKVASNYGGKFVKSLTGFGFVLLFFVLILYSGAAFGGQSDNGVATKSSNLTNTTGNVTQGAGFSLNITNTTRPQNATGILNANVSTEKLDSAKNVSINASVNSSGIQSSNKTIFMIDDGSKPIKHACNIGQSSINGASLMRIVDGTPHGYTTYYN
jgi:hypothetical protein